MNYQVLSRRYRPKHFKDVIGQQAVVKVLTNAIAAKKIPHAFLFTGIRGTGKTTTARIFARALNCKEGIRIEPCDKCESCIEILEGKSIDVMEIDGASNTSVNDVRSLKENTKYLPAHLRYKVYIIDEVHMLSNEAFNALLKTLEEPPEYVVFILATTEPHKIPETVLSRCIRLNFKRVEPGEITKFLGLVLKSEGIEYEENALYMIARQSEGSVRDSMSFLELVLAYGDGKVTEKDVVKVLGLLSKETIYDALNYLSSKDLKNIMLLLDNIVREGGDIFNFLERLIFYLRHLVLYYLNIPFDRAEFSENEIKQLEEIAKKYVKEELIIYYQGLRQVLEQMRFSPYPMYDFEVGLLKMVYLKDFLEETGSFGIAEKEKSISIKDASIEKTIGVPTEKGDKSSKTDTSFEKLIQTLKTSAKWKAYLEDVEIMLEDKLVKIVFQKNKRLFYEYFADHEERKKQVEKVVRTSLGKDYNVLFIYDENNGDVKSFNSKEKILNSPAIKKVMSAFIGSKILSIKEVERESVSSIDTFEEQIIDEEREAMDE